MTAESSIKYRSSIKDYTSNNNAEKRSAVGFLKDKSLPYSSDKIKDEFYLQLTAVKINGESKYEKQARSLIYRIPVYFPTPSFIINESDLSKPLINGLWSLSDKDRDYIIKEFICGIYESIDKDYFLLSIKRRNLIHWSIEQ